MSADQLFAWHERPGVLSRLTPPWEQLRIEHTDASLRDGARTIIRMRVGPTWQRWVAEHRDYERGRFFRDVQVHGPFARWEHEHHFEPIDADRCRLIDRIEYVPPFGRLGQWLSRDAVARKLGRTFAWRHRTLALDLAQQKQFADRGPLTVAITGASGFIGSALSTLLSTAGHRVRPMVRRPSNVPETITWDTERGVADPAQLRDVDAVIHLAGENIAGRWTQRKKRKIRDSRIEGTAALVRSLEQADPRPRTLISTSGMNYYGNRGEAVVTEADGPGEGFLAEVTQEWEAAAMRAESLDMRVARMRLGVVLSPGGGALRTMLTPFRFGGGGVVGSGEQMMSWVSLDDVIAAFYHVLMNDQVSGPVNVGAPHPVTNRDFTKTLGRVLRRPTLLPVPERVVRMLLGEMGEQTLLASTAMHPERLLNSGYSFRDEQLEPALRWLLGRGIG